MAWGSPGRWGCAPRRLLPGPAPSPCRLWGRFLLYTPSGWPGWTGRPASPPAACPQGTPVVPLLSSVLLDKTQWDTPRQFNPGHFLDADGRFVKRAAFLPFSAGTTALQAGGPGSPHHSPGMPSPPGDRSPHPAPPCPLQAAVSVWGRAWPGRSSSCCSWASSRGTASCPRPASAPPPWTPHPPQPSPCGRQPRPCARCPGCRGAD